MEIKWHRPHGCFARAKPKSIQQMTTFTFFCGGKPRIFQGPIFRVLTMVSGKKNMYTCACETGGFSHFEVTGTSPQWIQLWWLSINTSKLPGDLGDASELFFVAQGFSLCTWWILVDLCESNPLPGSLPRHLLLVACRTCPLPRWHKRTHGVGY